MSKIQEQIINYRDPNTKWALERDVKHYSHLIKNEKCKDKKKACEYWLKCIEEAREKLRLIEKWEWENKKIIYI